MERVDDKIVQIESMLDLLEFKLSSIPEEGLQAGEPQSSVFMPGQSQISSVSNVPQPPPQAEQYPGLPKLPDLSQEDGKKVEEVKEDPEAKKEKARAELYADETVKTYARMLKFGIPDGAIISKMRSNEVSDPEKLLEVSGMLLSCRKLWRLKVGPRLANSFYAHDIWLIYSLWAEYYLVHTSL